MIHHRPGFASRTSDAAPAKLNEDMIPALHKNRIAAEQKSTLLNINLPELSEDQVAKAVAFSEAAKALAAKHGPELLINPNPSATPIITSPHKE